MEQIDQFCNTCNEETIHDILGSGQDMIVRCTLCSSTKRIPIPKEAPMIQVKTIVSRETESIVCRSELAQDEQLTVGDFIVSECGEEAAGVEIMAIEIGDKRVKRAVAADVDTLWTRAVDQVVVRFSVHEGWTTTPLYLKCDGDEKFVVGDVYVVQGVKMRISHIRMRNGETTKRKGKFEYASGIKRIYGWKNR